jgi:hypothetical protein
MKTLFSSGSILAVLALLQAIGSAASSACPDDKKPKVANYAAAPSACPGDDKAPKPPSITG